MQLDRLGWHAQVQAVCLRIDVVPAGLDRRLDDLGARHVLSTQLQGPARDPGDIQEVVDQPGHLRDLPFDDVDRTLEIGVGRTAQLEIAGRVADGGQRIAQLVPEDRDELVLAAVALRALLLRSLAVGDVASNLRRSDDPAGLVLHGRDRQRHVDHATIFRAAHRVEVIESFTAPEPAENVLLLLEPIMGDDHLDRPPDHLRRLVPEDPRGAGIPARDDAVERLAYDRVVGCFDDRRQECAHLLGALPLGDVSREALGVDEASLVPEDARVDQDGLEVAVLAPQPRRILAQPFAASEPGEDVRDRPRIGMELGDAMADVFVARVSQHLELRIVGPEDRAVRTDPVHRDGCAIDQGFELVRLAASLGLTLAERVLLCPHPRRRPPEEHREQCDLDHRSQRGSERGVHDPPILEGHTDPADQERAADDDRKGAPHEDA